MVKYFSILLVSHSVQLCLLIICVLSLFMVASGCCHVNNLKVAVATSMLISDSIMLAATLVLCPIASVALFSVY